LFPFVGINFKAQETYYHKKEFFVQANGKSWPGQWRLRHHITPETKFDRLLSIALKASGNHLRFFEKW